MRMVDIIHNKRIGGELTREELEFFVQGVTGGSIPDYQVSALLMAICFRSMTAREIADLTDLMAHSGRWWIFPRSTVSRWISIPPRGWR